MKSILSIFQTLLLLLLIAGCISNEHAGENPPIKDTARAMPVQQVAVTAPVGIVTDLDFLKITTGKVDAACGEAYTYDTCQLKDEKYILMTDASDLAIIKINGAAILLKKDEDKSEQTGQESFKDVYRGKGYTVTLEVKQSGSYDTGSYYAGTMQITGDHFSTIFKVQGKAGC